MNSVVSKITIIYGLVDPLTNQLRYVGKTISGMAKRLEGHIGNARRGLNQPCAHWVRSLLAKSRIPEIFEIEACAFGVDWEEAEQFWIENCRSLGCRLLNLSIGGGAGALGWRATEETKRRMSLKSKGRIVSADARRKIGNANRGRPKTELQLRLSSERIRGEKHPRVKITEKDVPIIRALIAAGYSGAQVGKLFGIRKQSADLIFHRETWRHVPELEVDISGITVPPIRRLRGSENGISKLNESAVKDIRRRLQGRRETGKDLAKEYGVSTSVISAIRKRHTWRHVA